MKNIIITALLFIILLCSFSTSKKYDFPKDFNVSYCNYEDSYDGKTGYFFRIYNKKKDSAHIVLSDEDKEIIYKKFIKSRFEKLPPFIDCSTTTSSNRKCVEIYSNRNYFNVYYDYDNKPCNKEAENFLIVFKAIDSIINSKPEIKKMPLSDVALE